MITHFASVAEAAAYMYNLGWSTVEFVIGGRIMEDDHGRRVKVIHKGLLDVEILPLDASH